MGRLGNCTEQHFLKGWEICDGIKYKKVSDGQLEFLVTNPIPLK